MIELSAHLQQLLQKRVVCFFATIMPDGSPQLTQTWVDTDGTSILIWYFPRMFVHPASVNLDS